MIYLKPIGGLCNRLRTIDSLITICKLNNQDLTVLWVMDESLNCSYYDLFESSSLASLNYNVIDCPVGFPESFLKSYGKKVDGSFVYVSNELRLIRKLKNFLKGRNLNNSQKTVIKNIKHLDSENVMVNEELSHLYNAEGNNKSARQLDNDFLQIFQNNFSTFLANGKDDYYLSSCYRLYPLENNYSNFIPKSDLLTKINLKKKGFGNTYGLHIRRSDHVVSKNISTTDRFLNQVQEILNVEEDANFFLSTDDEKTKDELQNKFGNKILTNPISNYNRNHPDAIKDAVIDLYSLSFTKKIFGSHQSSFSQTAADIGNIIEVTVGN